MEGGRGFVKKTAILIDEMNAIRQLHQMGIEGIRPWKIFFQTVQDFFLPGESAPNWNLYGANVPQKLDSVHYERRERFFRALIRDGISVHKGFAVVDANSRLVEKGVDVLLSLDLVDLSDQGYDEIIIFSADGDIVPAVKRAREKGTKVKVVLNPQIPAGHMAEAVDEIIRLNDVLMFIPSEYLPRRVKGNHKPIMKKECVA
jgi:uncharacterized LabA/DUF88 family protein